MERVHFTDRGEQEKVEAHLFRGSVQSVLKEWISLRWIAQAQVLLEGGAWCIHVPHPSVLSRHLA